MTQSIWPWTLISFPVAADEKQIYNQILIYSFPAAWFTEVVFEYVF